MLNLQLRSAVALGSMLACLSWASPALAGAGTLSIVAGTGSPGAPIPGPATSSPLERPGRNGARFGRQRLHRRLPEQRRSRRWPAGRCRSSPGHRHAGAPLPAPRPAAARTTRWRWRSTAPASSSSPTAKTASSRRSAPAGRCRSSPATARQFRRGDRGPAASSPLARPMGVAVDAAGNLYIADEGNESDREDDAFGDAVDHRRQRQAGPPTPGPATKQGLSVRPGSRSTTGNLYIADQGNSLIEKVTPGGTLSIIAGSPAARAAARRDRPRLQLTANNPGVAVDPSGNLYIADSVNSVSWR